jgi:hypothetical protein
MTGPTWDSVRTDLVRELSRLQDREFVVLGDPLTRTGPTGLLRRRKPLPGRYVQFLRMGDTLSGECVGATSFGGDWDISPDQDARIRSLGWYAPGEMPDTEPGYPNYRHDVPRDQADRLADMGVQALTVLGVQPGGSLELRRDR